MSQDNNVKLDRIETSGGLEGELALQVVLSDPGGEPAIMFTCGERFLFTLPIPHARTLQTALARSILKAEKAGEEYGPMVRRAAKAEGN